jgi:hypothetical protein
LFGHLFPGNRRGWPLLVILLALAGCKNIEAVGDALVGPPLATFVVLDAFSVVNTQKTVDDHLVSLVTGKDCSTVRASQGDRYCIAPPPPQPMMRRTTYCYKSLADVTCYDRPLAQDAPVFYGTRVDDIPISSR